MSTRCGKCGGKSSVLETRAVKLVSSGTLRRRRECENCGHRWVTVEVDNATAIAMDRMPSRDRATQRRIDALDRVLTLLMTSAAKAQEELATLRDTSRRATRQKINQEKTNGRDTHHSPDRADDHGRRA